VYILDIRLPPTARTPKQALVNIRLQRFRPLISILLLTLACACGPKSTGPGGPPPDSTPSDAADDAHEGCTALETCVCQANADCLKFEDGDPCNGNLYCAVATGVCKVNPASIVTCKTSEVPCQEMRCDPADGKCSANPTADGGSCDDGDVCTGDDTCEAGTCVGTAKCACKSDSDCVAFDDEDVCNGSYYCDKGSYTCQVNPGTVVTCGDFADGPCTVTACDSKTGKCGGQPAADGQTCDADGLGCTKDSCKDGVCTTGASGDVCDCKADGDCAVFEDGDVCNGTLYCNLTSGKCRPNPASMVNCPSVDNGACRTAICNPKTGECAMKFTVDGEICDDGSACTAASACKDGECVGSQSTCTCSKHADCADQPSKDFCLGSLYCDVASGTCKLNPATAVVCSPANDTACLRAQCHPASGKCLLTPTKDGTLCESDGTWGTGDDTCQGGTAPPARPCATASRTPTAPSSKMATAATAPSTARRRAANAC